MRRRTQLSDHATGGTRAGEHGSVFIVALLALVLLTVIGLSLALVTETEMLLGGNEAVHTETFFASETAVGVVLAQTTLGLTDEQCLAALAKDDNDAERRVGARKLGYSLDTSTVYPVAFGAAAYSTANAGSGNSLYSGFFHAEVRALRGSWPATKDVPRQPEEDLADIDFTVRGEKQLDLSYFVSPIQSPVNLLSFDHPDVLGCEPHPSHAAP